MTVAVPIALSNGGSSLKTKDSSQDYIPRHLESNSIPECFMAVSEKNIHPAMAEGLDPWIYIHKRFNNYRNMSHLLTG